MFVLSRFLIFTKRHSGSRESERGQTVGISHLRLILRAIECNRPLHNAGQLDYRCFFWSTRDCGVCVCFIFAVILLIALTGGRPAGCQGEKITTACNWCWKIHTHTHVQEAFPARFYASHHATSVPMSIGAVESAALSHRRSVGRLSVPQRRRRQIPHRH